MSALKRALLIGDNERAPYHPLNRIEGELHSVVGDRFSLESITDYDRLCLDDLTKFDLCISYTDCWKESVSDELASSLLSYVQQGGSILVIHNGISLQVHVECYRLIGAKFTQHPPYQELKFRVKTMDHEIMRGIPSFSMNEEPYQYVFHPHAKLEVLMEYEADGEVWPAAWITKHEAGKLVYLMPGHHLASFQHPVFRRLIANSGRWLCP